MINVCPVCGTEVAPEDPVCNACGFKLAGSTQSFKPISVAEFDAEGGNQSKSATLRVIRGPQIGSIFALADRPMTVGRNPHCDIFLNDMTVSRSHAKIEPMGSEFCIVDENSFNGVWVNDKAVGRAILNQGDIVQIGVFCLAFEQN